MFCAVVTVDVVIVVFSLVDLSFSVYQHVYMSCFCFFLFTNKIRKRGI